MRFNPPPASARRANVTAFTLVELLVVIAIIAILAALGLPALKGFGKTNAIAAADRQLLDDLSFARQRAIADHTDVYVVFMPPTNTTIFTTTFTGANALSPAGRQQITNLLQKQFASYALYVVRSVGDQPGRGTTNYLTSWRTLPDGIYIATNKFYQNFEGVSRFATTNIFRFPSATNSTPLTMPFIAFNHLGQLKSPRDNNGSEEIIPLARGSIFYDATFNADPAENPRGNSSTNSTTFNRIRIDGLTGRARVEQFELK